MKGCVIILVLSILSCSHQRTAFADKNNLSIAVNRNDTPKILFMFYKIRYNKKEKRSEIRYMKNIIVNGKTKPEVANQHSVSNYIAIKTITENREENTYKLAHPLRFISETDEGGKLHSDMILLDSADLIFRINCENSIRKIELSENINDHHNFLGSITL